MDDVKSALIKLVNIVDQAIKKLFPKSSDIPTITKWVEEESSAGEQFFPHFAFVFYELREKIISLPEFRDLEGAINKDPALSVVCSSWDFVPGFGGHRNTIPNIAIQFLNAYFDKKYESNDFDANPFIDNYLSKLVKTDIEIEVFCHLEGIWSPIELEYVTKNVYLKRMSFEEVNRHFSDRLREGQVNLRNSRHFLGAKFQVKRQFSEHEPNFQGKSYGKEQKDLTSEIFEVLSGLRLFKPGYLEIDLIQRHSTSEEIFNYQGSNFLGVPHLFVNEYSFDLDDLEKFKIFYSKFEKFSNQAKEKYKNAIRWLNGTSLKLRHQDRFLDYVTILETLFLEQEQELSYRLKLRIAFSMESDPQKRYELYKIIGEAYKIRSKMVHTGKAPPSSVKINGKEIPIAEILLSLSGIVYKTIHRIVDSGGKAFPNNDDEWDKLIFSIENPIPPIKTS